MSTEAFCGHAFSASDQKGWAKSSISFPYLMSTHPGSTHRGTRWSLALFLKGAPTCVPEQVQDFYPTPGTVSTCMFHTGIDPCDDAVCLCSHRSPTRKSCSAPCCNTGSRKTAVLSSKRWCVPAGTNLIGHGPDCLVQPDREYLISRRAAGQGGPDPKLTAKPHPGARRPKSTHRKKR